MSSVVTDSLIQSFPYEIHQVRGPQGELVWVEKGINPDNVFDDKRRTDWPYSVITADLICQEIMVGASLTQVCKMEGFPSYSVVSRWRRENPEFRELLKQAYEDRAEYYLESALSLMDDVKTTGDLRRAKINLDVIKWITAPYYKKKSADKETQVFSLIVR